MSTAQISATDVDAEDRLAEPLTNRSRPRRRKRAPEPAPRIVTPELPGTHADGPPVILRRLVEGLRPLWGTRLHELEREHRHALALLESHQLAQRKLFAHDLAAERSLREHAEAAERAIRQTLDFKDAVIHEANHRVKNTLQVAASLLSLHSHATSSAEVRSALQQSYERLHVLARTHELLCASTDTTQAVLMSTLLQAMGCALRESFAEVSARVQLQIAADAIVLAPDQAIALALLANEVLTNAYKHAFPNDACGEVTVDLHRAPEGTMVLRITDSGVGMRSDGGSDGLGLKLIRTFATQLHGTLAIDALTDATGTAVTLTIERDAQLRE